MSIENTRLVIGSAKRDGIGGRETPPPACVKIMPVDPTVALFYPLEGGGFQSTEPDCAGQIVAFQDSNDPNNVRLFISINTTLWHPVNLTSVLIDTRTGKPYDPNAQFYNPLAS